MEVVVEGAGGDAAQFLADIGDASGSVGHKMLGVAQSLGGHDARAPPLVATSPRRDQAFLDPLSDQVAFHLGI